MIHSVGSLVAAVVLVIAVPVAWAQPADGDTAMSDDTIVVADRTIADRWIVAPRLRGIHGVAMTGVVIRTLGVSADADIAFNPGSRPRFSLGVRAGFESGDHGVFYQLDGSSGPFTAVDLLARFTIGGRSGEFSFLGGYAWVSRYTDGDGFWMTTPRYREGIFPAVGFEARWMFIPKYAGLVFRYTSLTNRLLKPPVPSPGDPPGFSLETGGIGFIAGWEP